MSKLLIPESAYTMIFVKTMLLKSESSCIRVLFAENGYIGREVRRVELSARGTSVSHLYLLINGT